jgi:PEGA domain-containing protein
MRSFKGFVCLALCVALATTGCASIVGKSQYPVTISSRPDQADITIVDEKGDSVYTGKTPTTVTLRTKARYFKGKNYTVTFQKEGYAKHVAQIHRGVSGWYMFGNFVFGGLIGWLIVDPATGAMWTLQKEVSVDLEPQSASAPAESGLRIVLLEDVPLPLRAQLTPVR